MCSGCVWQRSLAPIKRLLESGKANKYANYLTVTMRWVESNEHITKGQLEALARIEKKVGFKGVGDVRQDKPGNVRKGSGLFS